MADRGTETPLSVRRSLIAAAVVTATAFAVTAWVLFDLNRALRGLRLP